MTHYCSSSEKYDPNHRFVWLCFRGVQVRLGSPGVYRFFPPWNVFPPPSPHFFGLVAWERGLPPGGFNDTRLNKKNPPGYHHRGFPGRVFRVDLDRSIGLHEALKAWLFGRLYFVIFTLHIANNLDCQDIKNYEKTRTNHSAYRSNAVWSNFCKYQPSNVSSPCLLVPYVSEPQHSTFCQPSEPSASSELSSFKSNSTSEMSPSSSLYRYPPPVAPMVVRVLDP